MKRDKNNKLDQDDADQVVKRITKELITTSRDFQKEQTFLRARNNRRDIVVKVIVYQKNTVNGMIVAEDSKDPEFEKLNDDALDPIRYKYFDHLDGEIFVKEMPMRKTNVVRWTMGCFNTVINYLARMGVMDRL